MTERTPARPRREPPSLSVGQVAAQWGVTVRTLHHYDEIGLLTPSGRTGTGYRRYSHADVERLQQIVVYRRLGFALEDIAALLDDPAADVVEHLHRQRAAVLSRLDEMRQLVETIDHALEVHMSGGKLTEAEQKELFGGDFSDQQAEAERRWGNTDAWRQSQRRTRDYTKQDWQQIQADAQEIDRAFLVAMNAGEPASSEAATAAAERHRQHIARRFYDLSYEMHRGLGDMYLADPRFLRNYDDQAPGLAQYVRDAIHANADRYESA
jgi:DNA-binding transcriptional MerR regulator